MPLAILAGHTYNLCLSHVPALVRNAWEACKDKQLSGAILNWTATNFSPSFIKRQFASISESDGDRRIEDDSTVVKLLPNVNEIKVTVSVLVPVRYSRLRTSVSPVHGRRAANGTFDSVSARVSAISS